MDSASKSFSLVSHIVLVLSASLGFLLPGAMCSSDFSTLVYKKCSNRSDSTESHSQTLSSLFQELLPRSSTSRFNKTTAGDENIGISAFFQCRNDLSNDECYHCETSTHELLHETCSERMVDGDGFEVAKQAAFAAMESGVVGEGGFYETNYENLHAMAQCQGDLRGCDCGECVSAAIQVAEEKCGRSVSGQVYLDECFMSYTYYPDHGRQDDSYPENESGFEKNTGRTVAIVLGGAAVLVFGFILFRRCGKKEDI
ncbi:ANTIFUNGAL PROTEIN GINKBILOBIN-2-LIKE [Salix koriyanagi]|uniref:ANTIFUNGAL PROTEIN GINKBILOBIN-2-LIKE n=1 Tax=Salix koriyanagi TaxID=2511006 RepID=A0A9Q0VZ39_9ROSI|nr:ANTIFUNGAL PROTEIN GINKBILOBIN-2-LIKE [Salix koriyanagi]